MSRIHSDPGAATHPCRHLYGWGEADPPAEVEATALRFSVVVPTLNQGDTLEDTLLSLLHQNQPSLEIIVVDGGSSDGTAAVLERYRPQLARVISEPDRGQSDAINKGFREAHGDVLFWLNSDDYLLPGALGRVARCFAADPAVEFVVGAGDVISKDHHFLRHIPALPMNEHTLLNWKHDRWVMQQSCFWSRSLWQRAGGVDEGLHLLMDLDLWYRFAKACTASVLPQKLAVMRYYPDAKTVQQRSRTNEELAVVYAKNGAYSCLRELVADLSQQRSRQESYLQRIHANRPVRLLKRLSLFPSPD